MKRLEHDPKTIEKIHYPIIGFGGGVIHPQGIITLPLRVGGRHQSKNLNVQFLIVKYLTTYNIILGRRTLNQAKAVIVSHLMLMKYVCDKGTVGTIHGDQQQARDFYLTTLNPEAWGSGKINEEEIPSIDPNVAVHKLNVDGALKPVRQKKRNHGEARNKAAAEEVQKLLDASFIFLSQYPNG
ncbi:uncharacterized protein [Spinacia oleracea]|uniref:Uncharacterized protein n=1 Tax=Spinacia oleracea TaxID=3562 RepID=A0ABM3RHS8_SPIOL|nr:uncharacterized protein LOC130469741 [Spinacia oleracea]